MLKLFRKNPNAEAVYAVYNAIVAQSRQPVFYAEWGIEDTVTGRFDMISLHMALLFRRLRQEKGRGPEFAQSVFDLFFKDMDRSLREMGAGDLAVPKKIRNMGNIFFGLLVSLDKAMSANNRAELEALLLRNVYAEGAQGEVGRLADYLEAQSAALARQDADAIIAGRLTMEPVNA